MPPLNTTLLALIGGILPALFWLWFWLREDRKRPEPRRYIVLTFILGMAAVPAVIPFEQFVSGHFATVSVVFVLWAGIEELFKFVAAYFGGLTWRAMDEPIDGVIYLITAALGFAALENVLFLLSPLTNGNVLLGIATGNVRFIGATLLHTLASGIIGLAIAFSFYKNTYRKYIYITAGFILAIALHTLFNFFIMKGGGANLFVVLLLVWGSVIALILFFERIKQIRNPFTRNY